MTTIPSSPCLRCPCSSSWPLPDRAVLVLTESFPMLMIVGGVITAVVLVVSLAITAILCFKKKTVESGDYMSDMKSSEISKAAGRSAVAAHRYHSAADTGSSGADSDVKVEIRTSSSLSERQDWVEGGSCDRTVTANEIAQVVENIYNYSQQQQQQDRLYSSSNKIVSIYGTDPQAGASQPITCCSCGRVSGSASESDCLRLGC